MTRAFVREIAVLLRQASHISLAVKEITSMFNTTEGNIHRWVELELLLSVEERKTSVRKLRTHGY